MKYTHLSLKVQQPSSKTCLQLTSSNLFDVSQSHLDRVGHSVQELDDEQRWDFSLDDGQEEELAPEYADEIMVRGLQDGRHILGFHGFLLGLEEVVAHTPADDALPVFLQEDVSRVIDEKQAVDHLSCNSRVG